jgi:hypothetical protein
MISRPTIDLRLVGPEDLDEPYRSYLRPGQTLLDREGVPRRLPSYFYEIPSWDAALATQLTPNFGLWEFIDVDIREAEAMRLFPRYVPCAITLLAAHLQLLRNEVGRVVRIAANGGYRSPAHQFSAIASPHSWAAAANVYRVGDEWLDSGERVHKYIEIARRVLPGVWTRPYGARPGYAFDHLHVDLGYLCVEPHSQAASEATRALLAEDDGAI